MLNLIEKTFLLKKTPLFHHLNLDLLLTISDKTGCASYRKNQSIFDFGQQACKMYILIEGKVLIRKQFDNVEQSIAAHDFFGEESLFNDLPRCYQAISQTETLLLTLSKAHLLTIIAECPSVAIHLLEIYSTNQEMRKRQ